MGKLEENEIQKTKGRNYIDSNFCALWKIKLIFKNRLYVPVIGSIQLSV